MKFVISCLIMATFACSCGFALTPTFNFSWSDLGSFLHLPWVPVPPPPPPPPSEVVDPHALIREAAGKHGVPAELIKSIMAAESNFICDVVSPKGAIGLMQLMPETAKEFGADPTDPSQNVDAGAQYLRFLFDKYQKRRNTLTHVIAAYNAGPGAVDRYHGVPPFRETRQYVARVLRYLRRFKKEARVAELARQRHERSYEASLIASE